MQYFGLFALVFGAIIVSYPEFLSYLIGSFFLIIGINIIIIGWVMRRAGTTNRSWKFGGYEITRRK
ncbi:hypothetical protein KBD33_05480 [Candidatus Gracilibacteria bacterium]|nr:hypothetical protein [Candidatus Gracilibacteria bacterium]